LRSAAERLRAALLPLSCFKPGMLQKFRAGERAAGEVVNQIVV
jgi:hypothetical protein